MGNPVRSRYTVPPAPRWAGFTLMELLLYISLLMIIGAPLVAVALASQHSVADGLRVSRTTERNRTVLNTLMSELRGAIASTITLDSYGKTLQYTPPGGFDGSAPVMGSPVTLAFQVAPGEEQNGADDDGDGVVDEEVLVRTDTGDGSTRILSGDLAFTSRFDFDGTYVRITLVTAVGVSQGASLYQVTRTARVRPRN